jgi:protein phosphatase
MNGSVACGAAAALGPSPDRGGRAEQEDNYLVCADGQIRFLEGGAERVVEGWGEGALLAVADGMGGHADGALASGAAVQALSRLWGAAPPGDPEAALRAFVLRAHARLRDLARARGSVELGTTLTVAWLRGGRMVWCQVGDSRLYLLRAGALRQLSRDHTRREFAARDQRPAPGQPDALAQAFLFGSRGLSPDQALRIDPGLDTGTVHLQPGDRVLLCSDGVWGPLPADALQRELGGPGPCGVVAARLLGRAVARGGTDNLSAVVAELGPA